MDSHPHLTFQFAILPVSTMHVRLEVSGRVLAEAYERENTSNGLISPWSAARSALIYGLRGNRARTIFSLPQENVFLPSLTAKTSAISRACRPFPMGKECIKVNS
jgi:hypothetical protein